MCLAAGLSTTPCAGLLGGPFAGAALAQSYPDKPVRILVGFAAGGPTDAIARIVAEKLSARLGKQFYAVNPPGAGGNTATAMVAQSPGDGYTLLAVSTSFVVSRASSPRWLTIPSGTSRRSP